MPGGDGEFFPPVQYLPWWGLLGFGMLLLVGLWYFFVLYSTRASRVPTPPLPQQRATGAALEALRFRYLDLIDETKTAHTQGALDVREAHHQLSLLLRSYVAEREGVQTVQMTLKDLRSTPLTPLSDAVARLYPGAFREEHSGTVGQAADEAKRLVSAWR